MHMQTHFMSLYEVDSLFWFLKTHLIRSPLWIQIHNTFINPQGEIHFSPLYCESDQYFIHLSLFTSLYLIEMHIIMQQQVKI